MWCDAIWAWCLSHPFPVQATFSTAAVCAPIWFDVVDLHVTLRAAIEILCAGGAITLEVASQGVSIDVVARAIKRTVKTGITFVAKRYCRVWNRGEGPYNTKRDDARGPSKPSCMANGNYAAKHAPRTCLGRPMEQLALC